MHVKLATGNSSRRPVNLEFGRTYRFRIARRLTEALSGFIRLRISIGRRRKWLIIERPGKTPGAHNPLVEGSSPSRPTIKSIRCTIPNRGSSFAAYLFRITFPCSWPRSRVASGLGCYASQIDIRAWVSTTRCRAVTWSHGRSDNSGAQAALDRNADAASSGFACYRPHGRLSA